MKYKIKFLLAAAALLAATLACNGGNSGGVENPGNDSGASDGGGNVDTQLSAPPEGGDFANASDVTVTLGQWYVDNESGFLNVYGTVTNNADRPITGQITLTYFDKSGNAISASVLGEEGSDSIVFTAPVAPGETGFFYRARDLAKLSNGEVADVKAKLWYAVKEKKSPLGEFSGIEISEGDYPTYSGTVKNVGDAVCTSSAVEVAYLNNGKLVYLTGPIVENDLAPGDESAFSGEISADSIKGGYTDVAFALTCGTMSFER
jgi:hypothetical protein